jgi:serine protease AprX
MRSHTSARSIRRGGFSPVRRSAALAVGAVLTTTALSLAGISANASQISDKSDLFVKQSAAHQKGHGRTSVIVRIQGELDATREASLRSLGADIYRRLPIVRSVALRLPVRNVGKLAALPFVMRISADAPVRKFDEFTVGHTGADTAFAQSAATGLGVTVAVVDSGIRAPADLSDMPFSPATRVTAAINFVPATKTAAATTNDLCGHGTHVAGIVAGNGYMSTGAACTHTFYGIARRAGLVNVRVLDANGQGTVSQVISGLQWIVTNKAKYNIRVVNLSLGHPVGESYTTDPLCQAVESAWKAGIVVVCAAGNAGRLQNVVDASLDNEGYGTAYGSIQSPGNDPYAITVGAAKTVDTSRSDDRIATYSSRGPSRLDLILKPDIIAPGNKIISLYTTSSYLGATFSGNAVPGSAYSTSTTASSQAYYTFSGTSMAAPVVSGAVALMLQKYPALTPDVVKARLMLSADKWTQPDGTTDPCAFGAGYLNIPAALASTAVPNQPATSPSLSQDGSGNVFVNLDRAIWGTDINGQRAIWGVNGINDLRAVWGTRAIWGTSTNVLDASRAIWGTSVFSDRAIWGVTTGAADLSSNAVHGE